MEVYFLGFTVIGKMKYKDPVKVAEGSTQKKYQLNLCRKHECRSIICINSAVLGNISKRKANIFQNDFPNSTGIYFNKYRLCFSLLEKN